VNEKEILGHRITTLDSLLGAPALLSGATGGTLNAQLTERWQAERRLLERLMADTASGSVRDTVALWRSRTHRFLESSKDQIPGWTDHHGTTWNARLVWELLDEISERLDRWRDGPAEPASEEKLT
jgi:hypothetical protein